jgi:hypothetical protein
MVIDSGPSQVLRDWAEAQFRGAELSDVRRVERTITIGEAMAASPGASLPEMFSRRYDLKAAYELLRHPEATPDQLQAGHRERVLLEMEKAGTYLLLEDTSEILCAKAEEIEGLGPIGASKDRKIGFLLHSVLCVRWPEQVEVSAPRRPPVQVMGLVDQQCHVRQRRVRTKKARSSERRVLPAEELESVLWERASQRIGAAATRKDVIWVKVGDRGADIYDHIRECQRQRHRFVIRANLDRVLVADSGEPAGKLFDKVRESPTLGQLELELRARPGQAARTARLEISVTAVIMRSPQVAGHGPGARPPIECAVVRVWEPEAPAEVEALEWVLLTDLPAGNFEHACEVAQMYATRWLEEEFHKALKTGMGLEHLQLTTARAWFAVTALMSVAALRLISLREGVRRNSDAPAEAADMSELELKVLRARSGKPLLTVSEVSLAIGRLGGHLNRKSDGPPGWITLWRGWRLLQTLVEGVLLARKVTQSG